MQLEYNPETVFCIDNRKSKNPETGCALKFKLFGRGRLWTPKNDNIKEYFFNEITPSHP
jgi:hypothetical protein